MFKIFFLKLIRMGVSRGSSPAEQRGILLSNEIGLILGSLSLIFFGFYYTYYGANVVTSFIPVVGLVALSGLWLNYHGLNLTSRVMMSIFVPTATMGISIYAKILYYDYQQELDYFTFRFIILFLS